MQDNSPPAPEMDLYRKNVEVVFINAEFLFWRVEEGSLDYAFQMQREAWGPSPSYAQGKEKRAQFDFDPGIRASIGYFNAPKFWEVYAQYTWLFDKGNNTVNKPQDPNLFLIATWPQIFSNPVQKAMSQIRFHYHLADLLVDRYFIPNDHLRLRLLGGIPFTYQKQHWQVEYLDGISLETKVQNRWRYYGVGLKLGLSLDWFWGADFYISALFSNAALLGSYKNQAYQKTNFNPFGANNPDIAIRDALRKEIRLVYTAQFLFGLSYQKNFCNSRLEVFAGYELNEWFNLQEVYRSTAASIGPSTPATCETNLATSLVGLHGLTTRVTYNF